MSAIIRVVLLLAVFAGVAEMCGNIHQETPVVTTTNSSLKEKRKRSADEFSIVHIEFQTTLTSAGDLEFAKIENEVDEEFEGLLEKAHRQVATGNDGGSVLKYMFTEVDCGVAQLFARSVKDLTSFVTGGTIRCNGQASSI